MMQKINIGKIISISRDQLIYQDDKGNRCGIDLLSCANNYMASLNPRLFEYSERSEIPAETCNCVGERKFGRTAYYELFTGDHIRFTLTLNYKPLTNLLSHVWNVHAKDFELFYSIEKKLNQAGWATLDLN